MKERFDSYCGIYCGACSTPGCNGCKIMNENHWSPDCKFIQCAQSKNVDACPLCDQYPCDNIMEFEKDKHVHHKTVVPNGKRIKEIGLEAWLEEQKERWTCEQCGKGFTWFDDKCKSCGTEVFSANKEFANKGN